MASALVQQELEAPAFVKKTNDDTSHLDCVN